MKELTNFFIQDIRKLIIERWYEEFEQIEKIELFEYTKSVNNNIPNK